MSKPSKKKRKAKALGEMFADKYAMEKSLGKHMVDHSKIFSNQSVTAKLSSYQNALGVMGRSLHPFSKFESIVNQMKASFSITDKMLGMTNRDWRKELGLNAFYENMKSASSFQGIAGMSRLAADSLKETVAEVTRMQNSWRMQLNLPPLVTLSSRLPDFKMRCGRH